METKNKRKSIIAAAAIGAVLLAVAIFLVLFFTSRDTGFELDHTIVNAVAEKEHRVDFKIGSTKNYSITIDVACPGFITAVRIIDGGGNAVYRILLETSGFTIGKNLEKGDYTLILTYLTDHDAIEPYLKISGLPYEILPEDVEYFNEAFGRENTDYSGKVFVAIE